SAGGFGSIQPGLSPGGLRPRLAKGKITVLGETLEFFKPGGTAMKKKSLNKAVSVLLIASMGGLLLPSSVGMAQVTGPPGPGYRPPSVGPKFPPQNAVAPAVTPG